MNFLPEALEDYIEKHTEAESEVLQLLNRETNLKIMLPQMLSGHLQGQVLRMFSYMIKPENILEIGTYTGYSAICLTAGLQGGKLYTIDINDELEDMVRSFFGMAGVEDKIEYILGDATKLIPEMELDFDLVFIDADKENYGKYYDLVFEKVRPGGFIIADNVLWSGKVLEDITDKDTTAIKAFNDKVQKDERVENVLFPIRDGLMVVRKKLQV